MADGHEPAASILVIDDDAGLRALYTTALERAGYSTIAVASGEAGLAVLRERDVALLLCDLGLPGISGFDVVRAVRAEPATATLPIILITGSGDAHSVIEGLEAGADDFLAKPIRLDELIARVATQARRQAAWAEQIQAELRTRLAIVAALGRLPASTDAAVAATGIADALASRTGAAFVGVIEILSAGRGRTLAAASSGDAQLASPGPRRLRELVDRALAGPWSEPLRPHGANDDEDPFWRAGLGLMASAPIFWEDRPVGVLVIGRSRSDGQVRPGAEHRLLAAVIEYAVTVGLAIGPLLAARGELAAERARLTHMLRVRAFGTVFQPIVNLESGAVVGHEALTRFTDGTRPDTRFVEAAHAGLALDYELAAIRTAIEQAANLPRGGFLGLNISPDVLAEAGPGLRSALRQPIKPIVLEVTEHAAILDYGRVRTVVEGLTAIRLAVDDAGAGYASLRHILELAPDFVKLDISLVRGIEHDPLRQSLIAGLVHYAARSGISLIAEGIEQPAEAETMRSLGVELGQGYLFGRPAAA
ncbi:MAG TPA: EAL domain-containing protein [Candidatus Limnocylindrales bacterium]